VVDKDQLRARAGRYLPAGSPRREVAAVGVRAARDLRDHLAELRDTWGRVRPRAARSYAAWLAEHRATPDDLAAQRRVVSDPDRAPGVGVAFVVVADPLHDSGLAQTLRSLQLQTDPRWTAVVVGGGQLAGADPRVTSVSGDDPWSAVAEGDPTDLVVLLEAGDLCEPDLAFRIAAAAWERPMAVVVHWDDDLTGADGLVDEPRFRPSWSPEILLSANYLGRSVAIRRDRIGVLAASAEDGDARWWDALLALDLGPEEVLRVPHVLVHLTRRPDPLAGGAALVARHVHRRGDGPDRAEVTDEVGAVRVRYVPEHWPSVAVLIPTRHNRPLVEGCLRSLAATEYPSMRVRIIDNGERTTANEAWYAALTAELGLDLEVVWWTEPFNYSQVNNALAAQVDDEVLVFLNDDTVAVDPGWLQELAGWAVRPEIGLVGVQLIDPDGLIQHGGVIVGLGGFADHLFQGMQPGEDSTIGSSRWYRNALSMTAACVAVRRAVFEEVGGFDERFVLCGSDVVLGLDTTFLGLRNVCTPFVRVDHLESATRGTDVPEGDFFASYWRYQKWLVGGDPYFSPNLSLASSRPTLKPATEAPPMAGVAARLGRPFQVFRQSSDEAETAWLGSICRADSATRQRVEALHAEVVGRRQVQTVSWVFPDIDSPFYGGINTALRIADRLAAEHGVQNQFVLMAAENPRFFDSALSAAFPRLAGSPVSFYDGSVASMERNAPDADVTIATLWVTAYAVSQFSRTDRRAYLIQDFEPMFYPAGSMYALTEESYNLGLYGLCNTDRLRDIYRSTYRGVGWSFMPAVQESVFHAEDRRPLDHDGPARVFLYARPGHWRNCWELAGPALDLVKRRFGSDVHIVTAGSWARPEDLGRGIDHLGLLDYRDTGQLYRTCDAGIALTLSEHPSYLPLELLACGVPVVAFDNPAGDWIMEHERNALRTPRTIDGLAEAIGRLVEDVPLRQRLSAEGLRDIAARHGSWPTALGGIYDFLCDPEAAAGG
jgi:GT2 family glycosyltransferase